MIAAVSNAPGIILAVTENRNWIEVFFDGDPMHTQTVNLPAGGLFSIYVEETSNKTTVYEYPRTMIFFLRPPICALRAMASASLSPASPAAGLLKAPPVP